MDVRLLKGFFHKYVMSLEKRIPTEVLHFKVNVIIFMQKIRKSVTAIDYRTLRTLISHCINREVFF